jgi:hypothetical protein
MKLFSQRKKKLGEGLFTPFFIPSWLKKSAPNTPSGFQGSPQTKEIIKQAEKDFGKLQ